MRNLLVEVIWIFACGVPGRQAAGGKELVEDELRGSGERAEVAEAGRNERGRSGAVEPHQRALVAGQDGLRRRLVDPCGKA
jgi:hypothetical protein